MSTEALQVQLAERSYPIHFSGVNDQLKTDVASLRAQGRSVFVISDASVLEAHPDYLIEAGFEEGEILSFH